MEFVEQNISGVKLEKLRKDAVKKSKIMRRIFPVCLVLFGVLSVASKWYLFVWIGEYGWNNPSVQGALYALIANLMMAAILACVIYIFYAKLVWEKAYNLFNFSYKNKYILQILKQHSGFSDLCYDSASGFSYDEMDKMNLIPKGQSIFYQSTDKLTGLLDGIRFQSSNVKTASKPKGRRSLPDILFEGQIIAFSMFDERKISEGFVQVFSKKVLSQIKHVTAPLKIYTENSMFNENFVVFAENEQNAFYVLTPQVLEKIVAFQDIIEGQVYLAFCKSELYVTCSQLHNPFDAYIDIPLEEQRKNLEKDIKILCSAREILIQAGEKK